LSYAPAV